MSLPKLVGHLAGAAGRRPAAEPYLPANGPVNHASQAVFPPVDVDLSRQQATPSKIVAQEMHDGTLWAATETETPHRPAYFQQFFQWGTINDQTGDFQPVGNQTFVYSNNVTEATQYFTQDCAEKGVGQIMIACWNQPAVPSHSDQTKFGNTDVYTTANGLCQTAVDSLSGPAFPPTVNKSCTVTTTPTAQPTTLIPTRFPTRSPTTLTPTRQPTLSPTTQPSAKPTNSPTLSPTTLVPTRHPTLFPTTLTPTRHTTLSPTPQPSAKPTTNPTQAPTTAEPTAWPTTLTPTKSPTHAPTPTNPTTRTPTLSPTTAQPSLSPTQQPTTNNPTQSPTTLAPTKSPTTPTGPTFAPTKLPTKKPTALVPTFAPTKFPTKKPTTAVPTLSPTTSPSKAPTTSVPTLTPTKGPTPAESKIEIFWHWQWPVVPISVGVLGTGTVVFCAFAVCKGWICEGWGLNRFATPRDVEGASPLTNLLETIPEQVNG